jgi:hypothetical protein
VGVALLEAEQGVRVQPRVHAGEDRHALRRRKPQVALVETGSVSLGVLDQLVDHAHGGLPDRFIL